MFADQTTQNADRKLRAIYRMVAFSVTLNDPWPRYYIPQKVTYLHLTYYLTMTSLNRLLKYGAGNERSVETSRGSVLRWCGSVLSWLMRTVIDLDVRYWYWAGQKSHQRGENSRGLRKLAANYYGHVTRGRIRLKEIKSRVWMTGWVPLARKSKRRRAAAATKTLTVTFV